MTEPSTTADIIVAGAGASGLLAAVALAKLGFEVVCIGPADTRANGRTVALFEGSLRVLDALDLRHKLVSGSQKIAAITIRDDTGSRWPVPPLTLHAREAGLDYLGANIENDLLVAKLAEEASQSRGLHLVDDVLEHIAIEADGVSIQTRGERRFSARLLVAADGRRSPARAAAGIAARVWTYPQVAWTALLHHTRPHHGTSTEFHTRGGPCTLVPLAASENHPHRSSLVWLMTPDAAARRAELDDEALADELEAQTRGTLGEITFETARGRFPIGGLRVNRVAAHRTVLIGEAAHAFPPLAAQGLNLSVRDVAYLLAAVAPARHREGDPGRKEVTTAFAQARHRDIGIRTSGVDVMNRSIMTDFAPVDAVRGAGIALLRIAGPLRRAILREGILAASPDIARLLPRPAPTGRVA